MTQVGAALSKGFSDSKPFESTSANDSLKRPPSPAVDANETDESVDTPAEEQATNFGEPFDAETFAVTLESAKIATPKLKDIFGDDSEGTEPVLMIQFKIENWDERKILRYNDGGLLRRRFTCSDDVGNVIRGIDYGATSKVVGALTGKEDVLPQTDTTHIEVFSVPPPKTEFLELHLNLEAFGGDGEAVFKLPVDRIEGFKAESKVSAR